jgi:hypothetical protein
VSEVIKPHAEIAPFAVPNIGQTLSSNKAAKTRDRCFLMLFHFRLVVFGLIVYG